MMKTIVQHNWKMFLVFFVPLALIVATDFYVLIFTTSSRGVFDGISEGIILPTIVLFGPCIERGCGSALWYIPALLFSAFIISPAIWSAIGVLFVRGVQKISTVIRRA